MVEEKVPSRTIKVVDKRRFTTKGDPRDDVPSDSGTNPDSVPSPPPGPATSQKVSPPPPQTEIPSQSTNREGPSNPPSDHLAVTSPEFVELIATLAQQAEMLIVGAEGLPAEPEHARRIIDYIVALESKTAGNVSPEEKQILSSVVFQLRSLFLQRR